MPDEPDTAAPAALQLRNVSRRFGDGDHPVVAVRDASIAVAPGEFVAVIGASGSGKSTLLNLAGGLDTPTSGSVVVAGTDLGDLDPSELAVLRRRSIGYVFQDYNLIAGLTAVENVSIPLELDGVGRRAAQARARERLVAVGLDQRADAFPDDLSGGERQRVAIARAVIGDRQLVLADEPTGALDSGTGAGVVDVLDSIRASGAAVVVVTHDAAVAAAADVTVEMRDGRLHRAAVAPAMTSSIR